MVNPPKSLSSVRSIGYPELLLCEGRPIGGYDTAGGCIAILGRVGGGRRGHRAGGRVKSLRFFVLSAEVQHSISAQHSFFIAKLPVLSNAAQQPSLILTHTVNKPRNSRVRTIVRFVLILR